jgi:Isochorismatase family
MARGEGSPFDVRAEIGAIVGRVSPQDGEPMIVKNFPNAFVHTDLDERLKTGRRTTFRSEGS